MSNNNFTNQNISKPRKDIFDKFAERHPFHFLLFLGLSFWLFMTYTVTGQGIYKAIQEFVVSPLNLECDSYDGQIRVAIYIPQPIYNPNYIIGSMIIYDYAHNFLDHALDYNSKLKYEKDNLYTGASIIQEGKYRVSIMQNVRDALLIPNGGPSIPLI